MVFLPNLQYQTSPQQKQIITFGGYNVSPSIADGEMRNMMNLASDKFPNLSQRKARGYYSVEYDDEGNATDYAYPDPELMLVARGKLAVITNEPMEGAYFFYGGEDVIDDGVVTGTKPKAYPGVAIDPTKEHRAVVIHDLVCIWPEKIWFSVETGETGNLGGSFKRVATAQSTVVFQNDTTTACTVTINNLTQVQALSNTFKESDGLDITIIYMGKTYTFSAPLKGISESVSGGVYTSVLTFPADTFLTFLNGQSSMTFNSGATFALERYIPDVDFVMESNNRLWACYDNAIAACKLGDPTNWHYFQNVSIDSYEVVVGTDGKWTGCCPYSSHLLFFKENYIHKVYGNKPANYQTQQAECYSLERGSWKSVCVVNETVFYKSKIGIMAYSGSLPTHISANFGDRKFKDAVGGSDGAKYYVSMKNDKGASELFVFDLDRKLWHKEDDLDAVQFAYLTNDESNPVRGNRNQLLFIRRNEGTTDNSIYSTNPYRPMIPEMKLEWMAELGPFDEVLENKKIYSKIKMRLKLDEAAELIVSIKFNDGEWQTIRTIYSHEERAAYIPIAPVRCDKFYVRIEGRGGCTLESVVREYRERSGR